MARHKFREIVLMILAVLVGLGIVLLIGTSLFHSTPSSIAPGTGGVSFVVIGVSVKLFVLAIVAVVAIVVVLAVFLSRR
jgi:ABC-type phosphate transport system permease subunit